MDEAYGEIFAAEYERLLCGCVLIAGGDRGLAEDAVVEAFIAAYPKWKKNRVENLAAYLRTIATNRVYRMARRRGRVGRTAPGPVVATSPDDVEGLASARTDLTRILADLPLRDRQVLTMRHYFDMTERDVAAALDLPLGTVKTVSRRAIASLQRIAQDTEV